MTPAGQRLLAELEVVDKWPAGYAANAIQAIEAEAVAAYRDTLAERVSALPQPTLGLKGGVDRNAVLALIQEDAA